MADTRYFYACAHEQFPPDDLLRQAVEAEQAGFDGIGCSDHFQPWWEPGESGHAWVWLGAVSQATSSVPLGTAVTPAGARYPPGVGAPMGPPLPLPAPGRALPPGCDRPDGHDSRAAGARARVSGGRLRRVPQRVAARDGLAFRRGAGRPHGGGAGADAPALRWRAGDRRALLEDEGRAAA